MALRALPETIIGVGRYGWSGEKTHAVIIDLDNEGKPTKTAQPICLSQRAVPSKTTVISTDEPTQETVTCEQCRKFRCVK